MMSYQKHEEKVVYGSEKYWMGSDTIRFKKKKTLASCFRAKYVAGIALEKSEVLPVAESSAAPCL